MCSQPVSGFYSYKQYERIRLTIAEVSIFSSSNTIPDCVIRQDCSSSPFREGSGDDLKEWVENLSAVYMYIYIYRK